MDPTGEQVQGWLQLATSTGFVGLAWYLIVVALPKIQDKFDIHSKDQFERFEKQIDKIVTHFEKTIESILTRIDRNK